MRDHVPCVFEKTKTHEGIITGWKSGYLTRWKLHNIKFEQEKGRATGDTMAWEKKRNEIYS